MNSARVALTIAGSDPSGGAGIQADLKTFHQFGVYGEAAITLITVQNTCVLQRVQCLAPDLVFEQIQAVLADIAPAAIKLGALGSQEIIEVVASALEDCGVPVVIDPVMISKHGAPLMDSGAVEAFKRKLLPKAFLITPNLPEAAALTGFEDPRSAAAALLAAGAKAALVKGGHSSGAQSDDFLLYGADSYTFAQSRLATIHTHGTGCTYAAAITAELAKSVPLPIAVGNAKRYITEAIRTAPGLGRGTGPVNHFAAY